MSRLQHLLDMMLVKSWNLYLRRSIEKGIQTCMKLANHRAEVAYCLRNIGGNHILMRSRPSDLEKEISKRKKSPTTSYVPQKDLRLDDHSNLKLYEDKRQRCKMSNCTSFYIQCSKYELCIF